MSIPASQIYPNQKNASREIRVQFRAGANWVILDAQMQMGKTDTFLDVAAEQLISGVVSRAVILCGTSETTLKSDMVKQATDMRGDFWKAYISGDGQKALDAMDASAKIEVCFSQDFKKLKPSSEKTLWIWDESHYAQSKEQRPDQIWEKMGIDAAGGPNRNGDIVLSVSATGFSERIDNERLKQQKPVVSLEPGDGYISVQTMRDDLQIVYVAKRVDSKKTELKEALHLVVDGGVALIRVTTKGSEKWVKEICKTAGFTMENGGLTTWYGDNEVDINDYLNPSSEHFKAKGVILLNGRGRMGKRLYNKTHIKFVMETTDTAKSDTALQGLLGRMCGYGGNTDTLVYLPATYESYIDSYIAGHIPSNAMNVKKQQYRLHGRTIPDKLNVTCDDLIRAGVDRLRATQKRGIKAFIKKTLAERLRNGTFATKNAEEDLVFLRDILASGGAIKVSNLRMTSFQGHQERLDLAFTTGTIIENPGASCGVRADGSELRVWVDLEGLKKGSTPMYLQYLSPVLRHELPTTTTKEVFFTPRVEEEHTQPHAYTMVEFSALAVSGNDFESLCECLLASVGDWADDSDPRIKSREVRGEIPLLDSHIRHFEEGGLIYTTLNGAFGVEIKVELGPNKTGSSHRQSIKRVYW